MKVKRIFLRMIVLCLIMMSFSVTASASWKNVKGGRRYYISKTTYVTSRWKKINKYWFYFDEKGYVKLGRFKVNGKYYYCKKKTGAVKNKRVGSYYYNRRGEMVTDTWVTIKKHEFYFGKDGKIRTGLFKAADGNYYYCRKNTGKVTRSRVGQYYFNRYGIMAANRWVTVKGHQFYFGNNGKVKVGQFVLKGKTYCCKKDTGKVTSQWYQKHYYDENGVMAVSQWVNKSYVDETGTITKGDMDPKNPPSKSDIRLLAALVYYEAGNQSYYGKKCVASVVINRMNSKQFPNTLKGVIYQSGQFTPAMNGCVSSLYNSNAKIQSECMKAAEYILTNGSILKGYYYFNCYSGRLKIGDHYFS